MNFLDKHKHINTNIIHEQFTVELLIMNSILIFINTHFDMKPTSNVFELEF
jgi:hypothetical protein